MRGRLYRTLKMRIRIIQVSRRPRLPFWAVCLVSVWLALGAAINLLAVRTERAIHLCLFKWLTGVPCPTCGFTRGILSLFQGQISRAWLYNPLLFSILGVFFFALVLRSLFGRSVHIRLTQAERIAVWLLAIALFFANWVYVISQVG